MNIIISNDVNKYANINTYKCVKNDIKLSSSYDTGFKLLLLRKESHEKFNDTTKLYTSKSITIINNYIDTQTETNCSECIPIQDIACVSQGSLTQGIACVSQITQNLNKVDLIDLDSPEQITRKLLNKELTIVLDEIINNKKSTNKIRKSKSDNYKRKYVKKKIINEDDDIFECE
jgi:hypothetical protein